MFLSTVAKVPWRTAFFLLWVVNPVMTSARMHADKALYSPGYLAFCVKPLCRISASCWMQVGCGTYLLQPRCACNPSLSPLPPSCSGGCLEHGPQVCVCLCVCMHARMFICHSLSLFSRSEQSLACVYAHVYMHACAFVCLLFHYSTLCPSLFLTFLFVSKPVVYAILIKAIKGLSEALYILMIAAHIEHLQSTYFCQALCEEVNHLCVSCRRE